MFVGSTQRMPGTSHQLLLAHPVKNNPTSLQGTIHYGMNGVYSDLPVYMRHLSMDVGQGYMLLGNKNAC